MKNQKLIFLVVICLLLQAILFSFFKFPFKTLPVLDGFPVGLATPIITQLMLYWYLPIVAFSFYISGNIKDLLSNYGFLQISRNYKKEYWLMKQFLKLFLKITLFICLQIILISIITPFYISWTSQLFSLTLGYFLMLLTIFSLQYLLELFIDAQKALLIINGYVIISILAADLIYQNTTVTWPYYLLIPNYGMGYRTGLSTFSDTSTSLISEPINGLILLVVLLCVFIIAIKKFKTTDIL
ncbi:TPA_asm: DUF2705 domain-containing protein [Listeria monocytogenes]|uniref:DUF2705 family protein n=1 Tax=Listeria monocytogenes TaxID=1639 RepID=UPI000A1D3CF4|nr:DUF2705 family protein [Listeria monocytogenes]ARM71671.1 hypothetical protein LMxysn_0036 [Listeria monocytogenes]HAB0010199.1 DUF2705 domain-containing protein [Listeria monocytogenes]